MFYLSGEVEYDSKKDMFTTTFSSKPFISEKRELNSVTIKVRLTRENEEDEFCNDSEYYTYKYNNEFFDFNPKDTNETECRGDKCRRSISLEEHKVWCRSCHGDLKTEFLINSLVKNKINNFEELEKKESMCLLVKTTLLKQYHLHEMHRGGHWRNQSRYLRYHPH